MPGPSLATWMKQSYPSSHVWVIRMGAVAFAPITPATCQTQVAQVRDTTARPGNDVINCHRDTSLLSRAEAIFTAILCLHSHKTSQSWRNPGHLSPPSACSLLLQRGQPMATLLQKRIGFCLQGGEAFPLLYECLQSALFVWCQGVTRFVLRD